MRICTKYISEDGNGTLVYGYDVVPRTRTFSFVTFRLYVIYAFTYPCMGTADGIELKVK